MRGLQTSVFSAPFANSIMEASRAPPLKNHIFVGMLFQSAFHTDDTVDAHVCNPETRRQAVTDPEALTEPSRVAYIETSLKYRQVCNNRTWQFSNFLSDPPAKLW